MFKEDIMKRDYDQICANYKEKAKNLTVEELELLIKDVDLAIEDLLDRHECLAAKKRAYQRLIDEKKKQ